MDYAKFKVRQLQRNIIPIESGANFNLTNLKVVHESELAEGMAYTCTLEPMSGYYLPQVISVEGTVSAYGFKYDYTTGVIYIPSDEIIGELTITAEASEINNNIPAVLEVKKCSSDTYDGTTTYTGESFVLIKVFPTRGSTVTVQYGDVIKTVTGDYSTEQYDCPVGVDVFFGTFHGVTDEIETPETGNLTITGAYESYGTSMFKNSSSAKVAGENEKYSMIMSIPNCGAIRYVATEGFRIKHGLTGQTHTFTFDRELEYVKDYGFYKDSVYNGYVNLNKGVKELPGIYTFGGEIPSTGNNSLDVNLNFDDADTYVGGSRVALLFARRMFTDSYYASHSLTYNINIGSAALTEKCTRIGEGVIFEDSDRGIAVTPFIPKTVKQIDFPISCNENLTIDSENPYFCIDNSVIYNKEKTIAYQCMGDGMEISIPEGVTEIRESFSGCTILKYLGAETDIYSDSYEFDVLTYDSLVLPSTITKIGSYAFWCHVTELIINAAVPPILGISVFRFINSITVPAGCGEIYKAATGWSDYADKIVEASA